MTIRFRCTSCTQPIEIDDEWASKTVACPYCRKTTTAPAESTLENLDEVPTAMPLTGAEAVLPSSVSARVDDASQRPTVNTLAVVALILAGGSLASVALARLVLYRHRVEWAQLQEGIMQGTSIGEQMKAQSEFLEEHPEAVRWLAPVSILLLTSGLLSLAALICGVIAICRPQRRGVAAAALVMAGVVPILVCCGGSFLPLAE